MKDRSSFPPRIDEMFNEDLSSINEGGYVSESTWALAIQYMMYVEYGETKEIQEVEYPAAA